MSAGVGVGAARTDTDRGAFAQRRRDAGRRNNRNLFRRGDFDCDRRLAQDSADAQPDGERILTWRQLYDLDELPEHLIVIGSGVTGAEFVHAYTELGVKVTLVSSRDRVLPHEDEDAALVLEDVLAERGVDLIKHGRADKVVHEGDSVTVYLADGQQVVGRMC